MDLNYFIISELSDIDSLKAALENAFAGLSETVEKTRFQLYDTFDWRLHHSGLELIRTGTLFTLIHAFDGEVIGSVGIDGKKEIRFCRDFPASIVADSLKPVLEMRAILPVAEVEKKVDRFAICNTDGKTVARLQFESLAIPGKGRRIYRCRLLPIKGYDEESKRVRSMIQEQHLLKATASGVVDLLRQSGIDPGAYSSRIDVSLQPEMPAAKAVQLILENLVGVMHRNLEGVRQDIDTEFLHDLRVAIRRGRSLLGQTKGVFDEDTTALLQGCLKTMGGVSGRLRDLDVYLLRQEAYLQKVPEMLRPGILQLFQALRRRRRSARGKMLQSMDGKKFKDALKTLDHFLQSEPAIHVGSPSIAPIGELSKAAIYKRFRRIIRKGRLISMESPDAKLHEVRIEGKKLRYLLEFFISLFPADEMKRLIKLLKGIQDNLGEYNDLSVQQEFLIGYLEDIRPQTPRSMVRAAAIGGLITRLFADRQRVRSEFLGAFASFGSEENRAAFKTLFT